MVSFIIFLVVSASLSDQFYQFFGEHDRGKIGLL